VIRRSVNAVAAAPSPEPAQQVAPKPNIKYVPGDMSEFFKEEFRKMGYTVVDTPPTSTSKAAEIVPPSIVEQPAPVSVPSAIVIPQPDSNGRFATPAEGAKFYASKGIPQVPLSGPKYKGAKPGKNPAINGTGWQDKASTDFAQIGAWAKQYPACNFGSVAKHVVGAYYVLECDSPLPLEEYKTLTGEDGFGAFLITKSSKGYHYWFKHDEKSVALISNIGQIVGDFSLREHNQQCVTVGSIHELGVQYSVFVNGSPAPASDKLLGWFQSKKKQAQTAPDPVINEGGLIPQGQIHPWMVKKAGELRAKGLTAEEIELPLVRLVHEHCEGPIDEKKILEATRSICKLYAAGKDDTFFHGGKIVGSDPDVLPRTSDEVGRTSWADRLQFAKPVRGGTAFDYALGPIGRGTLKKHEGLFPLGAVSLAAAPSGGGKTTFIFELLLKQRAKECVLDHEGYGLPFIVLQIDRGPDAAERTLRRMEIDPLQIPLKPLTDAVDFDALQYIVWALEKEEVMPSLVYVEGLDMLVSKNEAAIVRPFMAGLERIAHYYHIAIVGSVGTPKQKLKDSYIAKRDNIIGTTIWGRKVETVVCLQYLDGDDTDSKRLLFILPRNGVPEIYKMVMDGGRLIVDLSADMPKIPREVEWFANQFDWFTTKDVEKGLDLSTAQAYREVGQALKKRILKTRKHAKREFREYYWSIAARNPYLYLRPDEIKPRSDEGADQPEAA
jgi:hypothetical protein